MSLSSLQEIFLSSLAGEAFDNGQKVNCCIWRCYNFAATAPLHLHRWICHDETSRDFLQLSCLSQNCIRYPTHKGRTWYALENVPGKLAQPHRHQPQGEEKSVKSNFKASILYTYLTQDNTPKLSYLPYCTAEDPSILNRTWALELATSSLVRMHHDSRCAWICGRICITQSRSNICQLLMLPAYQDIPCTRIIAHHVRNTGAVVSLTRCIHGHVQALC